MLDHIGFAVNDFETSKAFYLQALAPLNMTLVADGEGWAMLGEMDRGQFWFGIYGTKPGPIHVAFTAKNREQVRAFYTAALDAGGKDNGAPGIREQYHPNYYAAYVIDPDGHNIEAVCHHTD